LNKQQILKENQYMDNALDKINKLGGFKNLPDIDKLALLTHTDNENELKKLNLGRIFRENGGTFGRLMIKVKIKPKNEQPIKHKFSQDFAEKTGWLYPYINYSDENEAYVTVRFDEFNSDINMKGGGTYEEMPIMLDNMYPIGFDDIKSDFVNYDNKVDFDRKEFLDRMGLDLNENITKSEFNKMKEYLKNGGTLQNDAAGYQILIRKDGERVFYINGNYKFFKDEDSFIRAAIRTVKTGY
jgi:hypothetical protein